MNYQITKQESDRLWFRTNQPLRPGTVLQVSAANLAVVSKHHGDHYEALLMQPNVPVDFIDGSGCWEPSGLEPQVQVPEIFFYTPNPLDLAILSVPCASPETRPGRIEWVLYFSFADEDKYVPIVSGCDYRTPRECFFSHRGRWQVGKYRLVAKRYSQPGHFFITEGSAEWVLTYREQQLVLTAADKSAYIDLT